MYKLFTAVATFLIFGNVTAQNFDNLTFGTDSTLDVMTWNIEHFPKNGQTTIDYVTEVILAMDLDVIGMQEIDDVNAFDEFIDNLDGYDGFRGNAEYARLGYIYKTSEIQVNDIYEIITNNSQAFSRPPLVMELTYEDKDIVLINNHFKCCGDGTLEPDDPWDEESRRLLAVNLLEYQLQNTFVGERVVLMGDLNDILTDNVFNNVFLTWLNAPEEYLFADMDIAEGDDDNWSYPTWPSHLDHIMITNEIFEEESDFEYSCNIVRLDDYMNNWSAYDANISDHRPVSIQLDPKEMTSVGINDVVEEEKSITNFPNPFYSETVIVAESEGVSEVFIYGIDGQLIETFHLTQGDKHIWNATTYGAGIYFATVVVNGVTVGVRKMVAL